jgi:hypothetical protein
MRSRRPLAIAVSVAAATLATPAAASCPDMSTVTQPGVAWCPHEVLPADVVGRADKHIAAATSRSYQATNYRLLTEHVHFQRDGDCSGRPIGYSLLYRYSPLSTDPSASVEVTVYVPSAVECPTTGVVVLRDAGGAIVEPKIPRDEAIRLARNRWPDAPSDWTSSASLSTIMGRPQYGWRWLVGFTGPGTSCWPTKSTTVDANSGKLLSSDDGTDCE